MSAQASITIDLHATWQTEAATAYRAQLAEFGIVLPVRTGSDDIGVIFDAAGRDVATIDSGGNRDDAEAAKIADALALAINMAGGFTGSDPSGIEANTSEWMIGELMKDEPGLTREQAIEQIREAEFSRPKLLGDIDSDETCVACGLEIEDGDFVYYEHGEGGHIHAECCGPERESYTGPDGEPLKDGEPIPEPFVFGKDQAHG